MLGSGAFGTAMSALLADNGFQVNMWCYDPCVVESVEKRHCNELYLPDTKLSKNIIPFKDIGEALEGVTWVFEATPVKFLRSVLEKAAPFFLEDQIWVVLSKGIEKDTLFFPSQMIDDVFDKAVKKAVVSGPSFAKNVVAKKLTAVDIAAEDETVAKDLQGMLENDYFKTHLSSDIIGVQIGGALKNVVAIAIGMLDGAGYTDNTKAFFFTTCLQEMVAFANFFGAKPQTLYGLSGIGDLVLTSMGGLSRNLMVGRHLGLGETLEDILEKTGVIPEGINTVKSVHKIIKNKQMRLPIFQSIYEIIFGGKSVDYLVCVLKKSL